MRHKAAVPQPTDVNAGALAVLDWPVPAGAPTRGTVLLVHSLGEHMGRYFDMARQLNGWGFAVRGFDQYGHGASPGIRGGLPDDNRLLDDLVAVIDDTRAHMDDRMPLILLGHSVGGLLAARLVSLKLRRVDALVLASPALSVKLNALQAMLVNGLYRFAPQARMGHGREPSYLSHDPQSVEDYRCDPLVHDRVSLRLAHFITSAGPAVMAQARQWSVPTLLLYAGQNSLVGISGSAAFARAAPRRVVNAQVFPMHYHDLFHELDNAPVFDALRTWLCQRFVARTLDGSRAGPAALGRRSWQPDAAIPRMAMGLTPAV
ncbi:lysophospholipase [Ottowia sp.]|uniref:alpha/beta hydrolase n=1 Tax=Ottowia sp. TaxID=1898956 RepID=UPI003A8426B4